MRDDTPRVGLVVDYRNQDGSSQRYRCVALSRRSGATWLTSCAVCGARFTVTSDPNARSVRHRLGGLFATRCSQHRRHDRIKRKPAEQAEQPA